MENPKDQYITNKYVVTKTTQDKTDFYEKDNIVKCAWFSSMSALLIIGLDALFFKILSKTKLKSLKEEKKENKMQLEQQKQLLLEMHTQMDELTDVFANLKTNVEKDYQTLPNVIQQEDKIKQKMKLFDDNM